MGGILLVIAIGLAVYFLIFFKQLIRKSKKIYFIFLFLMAIFLHGHVLAGNVSGDVRGVTFFYLDGGGQDFPWVLNNQYNSDVRTKIDNLLTTYRTAGVNWIKRMLLLTMNNSNLEFYFHFYPSSENKIPNSRPRY